MKQLAEAYIIRDGKRLVGEQIVNYHKIHNTASYNCIDCGAEMPNGDYPCPVCKIAGDEIKLKYERVFINNTKAEVVVPYK